MSDEQNQQQATQRTWTEAPASATVKARYNGREWMITVRDERVGEIIKKIDALSDWLDKHAEAVNIEAPSGSDLHGTPTPRPAPQTTPTSSGMGGTFRIVKMTVTPRADGKVDLNFFEAGHQYADIKAVKTPSEACILLQNTGAWTTNYFEKVGDYQVNFLIDWKPSENLNKNGKPYKNIVTVSPA